MPKNAYLSANFMHRKDLKVKTVNSKLTLSKTQTERVS